MKHRSFFHHEHPIAMAHRGGAGLWPENTWSGFLGSVELGLRYIETDLHATRDGVLVCLHDHTLDRTTERTGFIWDLDWEEVSGLDAGYRFRPEEDYPWRGKAVRVPRLSEVVDELARSCFTLELKQDGLEELLVELIAGRDLWERVLVGSFSDRRLRRFRQLSRGRVATSAGERLSTWAWVASRAGLPFPTPADALQLPLQSRGVPVVDARLLRAAHRSGHQVHVWTVDDPGLMRDLLALGVDGIISDRPDILQRVLAEERHG